MEKEIDIHRIREILPHRYPFLLVDRLVSLIIDAKASQKNVYLFAGVDKARFKAPVEPGDQLLIEVALEAQRRALWKCSGKITVDGHTVCSADVLFTHRPIE